MDVFNGLGEKRLLQLIEKKLKSNKDDIVIQVRSIKQWTLHLFFQALYIIVNSATGSASPKYSFIQTRPILNEIYNHLVQFINISLVCLITLQMHPKAEIRVAAVWCIINLTWPDENGSSNRVDLLRSLGFEERLMAMEFDSSLDVRERVATALLHFSGKQ